MLTSSLVALTSPLSDLSQLVFLKYPLEFSFSVNLFNTVQGILLLLHPWLIVSELNSMCIVSTRVGGKWHLPCSSPEERHQAEANKSNPTLVSTATLWGA